MILLRYSSMGRMNGSLYIDLQLLNVTVYIRWAPMA